MSLPSQYTQRRPTALADAVVRKAGLLDKAELERTLDGMRHDIKADGGLGPDALAVFDGLIDEFIVEYCGPTRKEPKSGRPSWLRGVYGSPDTYDDKGD